MSSLAAKFVNHITSSARPCSALVFGLQRSSKMCYSTVPFEGENNGGKITEADDLLDESIPEKQEALPQGVDPRRALNFKGVHKAIICGKIRQIPVQKPIRNGRTLTIFDVGTGGRWDHRISGKKDSPQWHRVVVHNETLGAYAVKQLVKNSSVYVEGDIEIRICSKGISGEVVKWPEICVRNDGKVRLIETGESTTDIPFKDLREGLL